MRRSCAVALATLVLSFAARSADAYGLATHVELSRQTAKKLAQDPRYKILRDEHHANAFLFGSLFPDVRSVAEAVGQKGNSFEQLKQKIEASAFVKEVKLSTIDVKALGFDTHDREWILFLIDKAEAWGHDGFKAFAWGNLAHVAEDTHAQVLIEPHYMVRTTCGDVGVRAVHDPAAARARWAPGGEVDDLFDAVLDSTREAKAVKALRDLPRKLAGGFFLGRTGRSLKLRAEILHLWWLAAKEWHDVKLGKTGFITELGFQNLARLLECVVTLYPFALDKESAGDAASVFKDRFVDLPWWADAVYAVVNGIVRVFTLGFFGVGDIASCILRPDHRLAGALGGVDPVYDVMLGAIRGGEVERQARARFAGNVEFQRLDASGFLRKSTYVVPLGDGAEIARDLITRRRASRWSDDAQWHTFDPEAMRSAAVGALATLMGPGSGYAGEPALLATRVRITDRVTGKDVTGLKYPGDIGRLLRVEVELHAPVLDPGAAGGRDVGLTVRSDRQQGRADPAAATTRRRLTMAELTPANYGTTARPKLTLDFTAPPDVGQQGLYVELDAGRGVFYTTNLAGFSALTKGRPQYETHYAPYGGNLPAVTVTR